MTEHGLRLAALSAGYRHGRRKRVVLPDLDALARPGELTALIGPNGTGKSTLLRTVAGLQPALGGEALLDGARLDRMSATTRARRQAIVLTDRVAPGRLSARELVALGRHPHTGFTGALTAADRAVVDEALEVVGASALAGRDITELSDGERQRVMTARALAQEPRLLLMDEPSAFLDAPGRVALAGLVRRIAREREAVVVVSTHEVELMLQVADRIWLLDREGRLHSGIPEDLLVSGLLNDVFDSDDLAFDPVTCSFRLTAQPVGRVFVTGSRPPGLDRLLARTRWEQASRDEADAEIRAHEDGSFALRRDGAVLRATDLDALAEALRSRGPVTSGVDRAKRLGAVGTG